MRVSPVNRSRISNIAVMRQTVVGGVDSVEKPKPITALTNNPSNFSDNFWLSNELFYDSLGEKLKEQHDFQLHESPMGNENIDYDKEDDAILNFIEDIIKKYNIAIDYMKDVDKKAKTDKHFKVAKIVTSHNRPLSNLGITTDRNYHLSLNKEKFLLTSKKSPHHMKLLLDPEKGIIRKIYDGFKGV